MHYKYGGKTLYYNNTPDDSGEVEDKSTVEKAKRNDDDCESGACKL